MEKNKIKKVVVGLSGGLDSSIALFLLKKQGYQPIGVSLKFSVWPNKKNLCRENLCCTNESFNLARKLCHKLDVPYHLIDCQKEFNKIVINYFIRELKADRTPNPCVVCNQKLRFPKLFQLARKLGASYVATGHYAHIRKKNNESGIMNYELWQARDRNKDQTYFLYTLKQNQLAKLLFPLGKMTKDEVREMAAKEKIQYTKKESQDFCFVANQSLIEFLKIKIGQKPGPIYDTHHNLLGAHQGLHFYTIGQRKGLSFGKKYWVCGVNKKNNTLIITDNLNDISGQKKEIFLTNFNFINSHIPTKPTIAWTKCRSQQKLVKTKIYKISAKGGPALGWKVIFDKPQWAITPGQSCVFYQGKVCLGGGVIK